MSRRPGHEEGREVQAVAGNERDPSLRVLCSGGAGTSSGETEELPDRTLHVFLDDGYIHSSASLISRFARTSATEESS